LLQTNWWTKSDSSEQTLLLALHANNPYIPLQLLQCLHNMPLEHQISLLARVARSGYQPIVFTIACSPTTPRHHPRTRIWSLRMHSRETGVFVAKNPPETHCTLHTNPRASCSPTTRLRLHRLGLPTTSRTDFVPFGSA
jgi:hypothetical protein